MVDFEYLDNKNFAYGCLGLLNERSLLQEAEINILTSEEECKRRFCCTKFPILSEVSLKGPLEHSDCYDARGRQRYYKEKIYVKGRAFVVSNHWYGPNKSIADNRTPFLQWVLEKVK